MRKILTILFISLIFSCSEETIPKPKAYLNLQYAKPNYKKLAIKRPYIFLVPDNTNIKDKKNNWLKIEYPTLKASVDITYRHIQNNLKELLMESQKLVFKHTQKAEQIMSNDFVDVEKKVFGSIYEITGNAASQVQFHLTDSTQHFIKGALYFNVRPNYDSLLPAINYIKKDITKIIETIEWQ